MDLFPAIDLSLGSAVRLRKGDFNEMTNYGDATAIAQSFLEAGARWLHVVDLDGARSGERKNASVIRSLCALAKEFGARVEVGGGVRSVDDAGALIALGAYRVIVGTTAVEEPVVLEEMVAQYPEQIAVGVDYRTLADGRSEVALRGWLKGSGQTVRDVLARFDDLSLAALIVTAIERDGTFEGPDITGLAAVVELTKHPVIASGGVGALTDVLDLGGVVSTSGKRLSGVVVGKALVDGRISAREAIEACEASV